MPELLLLAIALFSSAIPHTHTTQRAQLRALEQHGHAAEVLLDALRQALAAETAAAVLAVHAALKHGALTRIARTPSALPVATGVELRLTKDAVLQVLEQLPAGVVVLKGPCAAQCSLAVLPYSVVPDEDMHLVVEMRCDSA